MNNLKIPPQYNVGFRLIIKTDEPVFNKLLNAITECHPSVDINNLSLEISPKIEELSINDLQEILRTIRSIYSLRNRENIRNNEIIRGLINAVSTDESFSDLSAEELTVFEYRLNQLFVIDGCINISSEAITLLQEYEHIFSNSRIVTDVRPIFKTEKKRRNCRSFSSSQFKNCLSRCKWYKRILCGSRLQ